MNGEDTVAASENRKWVVNIKGGPGKQFFEISVLLDSNEFGKRSYGWFDKDKLLVTHTSPTTAVRAIGR